VPPSPSLSQAAAAAAAKTASEPFTGQLSSSCTVTSTGGVSFALRIPKDRMVRSCTVPAPSTEIPSRHTHPSAWWTAPMQ